jgi:hypothetical protein
MKDCLRWDAGREPFFENVVALLVGHPPNNGSPRPVIFSTSLSCQDRQMWKAGVTNLTRTADVRTFEDDFDGWSFGRYLCLYLNEVKSDGKFLPIGTWVPDEEDIARNTFVDASGKRRPNIDQQGNRRIKVS